MIQKNTLLYLVAGFSFIFQSSFAQLSTISTSITVPNPQFVKGVTGITNEITVSGLHPNTSTVRIYVCNHQYHFLDSVTLIPSGGSCSSPFDMGTLDETAEHIYALSFDFTGLDIDMSDVYDFTIKPTPAWIIQQGGTASATSLSSTSAEILCTIPLMQNDTVIDGGVVGIGNKSFGVESNSFVFSANYPFNNTATVIDNATIAFRYKLKAFDYPIDEQNIALNNAPNINLAFDANLNLTIDASYSKAATLFDYNTRDWSLGIPSTPFKVSFGAGLKLQGGFALRTLYGYNNATSSYGFIRNSPVDVSSIAVGAKVTASVWGSLNLISKRIAGVKGTLYANGKIGAAYQFETKPSFTTDFKMGGDLLITGKLELTGVAGKAKELWCSYVSSSCEPNQVIADGSLFPSSGNPYEFNGGLPANIPFADLVYTGGNSSNGSRSNTFQSSYLFDIPQESPQPSFNTKNANVATVWLESDTNQQYLLLSRLDTVQNNFSNPLVVVANNYSISNPKIAQMNDGSSIITWTQNRYNENDITSSMSLEDITDGQDIWFAIYEAVADSIVAVEKVSDNNDMPQGMATVTISKNDKAIITWLAEDAGTNNTDIWVTEISKSGNNWIQQVPSKLHDLTGNNYGVNVSFIDSVHAVAVWINDSDANDTIGGNQIMSSLYNGSNWLNPVSLTTPTPDVTYNELSMDFNTNYGALSYTYSEDFGDGKQQNSISVDVFDIANDVWDTNNNFSFSDSLTDVRLPRASVSDDGIVAVSYQTVNLFSDSTQTDEGQINLILNNLPAVTGWQKIENETLLADADVMVWEMDASFGKDNILYTLSQENDTILGNDDTYQPATGLLFGSHDLNLVLRGLKVNPNLSVSPIAFLPNTPTGIKSIATKESLSDLKIYPNPFTAYTTIEYTIHESGNVRIEVYDLLGNKVSELLNQKLGEGKYQTVFEAGNLNNGIFFYRFMLNDVAVSGKIILSK